MIEAKVQEDQVVHVVENTFKPFEASDHVLAIIDALINQLKIQSLRCFEYNHHGHDSELIDKQIADLVSKKQELTKWVKLANDTGCKIATKVEFQLMLTK